MAIFQLSIPGKPFAWKRPAQGRTRSGAILRITDKAAEAHKKLVARQGCEAWGADPPWFGSVKLLVIATFAIPASWPKPLQAAARRGEVHHDSDPDFDNIAKQLADALKFVSFVDDNQIGDGRAILLYGDGERTDLWMAALGSPATQTPAAKRREAKWRAGGYDPAIAKAPCGTARWPRVLDASRRGR